MTRVSTVSNQYINNEYMLTTASTHLEAYLFYNKIGKTEKKR